MAVILRDKAAWDAFCADGRASLAQWTPPEYPCAVAVSWTTPAFFTLDDARTLVALASEPAPVERENDRCAWCGWPLADNINEGCVRGNCSQRPLPATFYDAERAFDEAKSSYTRQRIKDSVPGLRR